LIGTAVFLLYIMLYHPPLVSASLPIPVEGCPMAHCDPFMSDNNFMMPPLGSSIGTVWQKNSMGGEQQGSYYGLGCSSNTVVVACTYGSLSRPGLGQNLIVYDFDGNALWNSGPESSLNNIAYTSAPLFDADGNVYVADNIRIVKYSPAGTEIWRSNFPSPSAPISPVPTESGYIILGTISGYIYAYDMSDGSLLGSLLLKDNPSDSYYYQTRNTPAVVGDKIYISSHRSDDYKHGALFALRLDPSNQINPLQISWKYDFAGPSGASPLVVATPTETKIYFDGDNIQLDGSALALIYGISDIVGDYPDTSSLIFQKRAFGKPGRIVASFALDPRGGFWTYVGVSPWLQYRDSASGIAAANNNINVDALINDPDYIHLPMSAMSIVGTPTNPIMIVSAITTVAGGNQYVIAIDLVSKTLLWKVQTNGIGDTENTAGQFPILSKNGEQRVIFSTRNLGARAIGLLP